MKLLQLYQFQRFRDSTDVKVLRHKVSKRDLWSLHSNDKFGRFQDDQSWDVFGDARYVISFIAERNKYAKFVGVWVVLSKREKKNGKGFRYKTRRLSGFEDLVKRLVIRWGEGTRSWAQWLHGQGNKDVVELLPQNYVMDFPGFYNFSLSHDELVRIVTNPDSNREWQRMLSSVCGVYVILDRRSGKLYVGSAYGKGGFWTRWRTYVKSPSGGNMLLKKLLQTNPARYKHFQYSILRVLEPSATKDEVILQEVYTKQKLGSKSFGLNSN
jgi:hypothetical protein